MDGKYLRMLNEIDGKPKEKSKMTESKSKVKKQSVNDRAVRRKAKGKKKRSSVSNEKSTFHTPSAPLTEGNNNGTSSSRTTASPMTGNQSFSEWQHLQDSKYQAVEQALVQMAQDHKANAGKAEKLMESLTEVILEAVTRGIAKCAPIVKEAKVDLKKLMDDSEKIEDLVSEVRGMRLELKRGPLPDAQ